MMKADKTVMGVNAPPPRILLRGFMFVGALVGGPIVGLLFAIDLFLWLK